MEDHCEMHPTYAWYIQGFWYVLYPFCKSYGFNPPFFLAAVYNIPIRSNSYVLLTLIITTQVKGVWTMSYNIARDGT